MHLSCLIQAVIFVIFHCSVVFVGFQMASAPSTVLSPPTNYPANICCFNSRWLLPKTILNTESSQGTAPAEPTTTWCRPFQLAIHQKPAWEQPRRWPVNRQLLMATVNVVVSSMTSHCSRLAIDLKLATRKTQTLKQGGNSADHNMKATSRGGRICQIADYRTRKSEDCYLASIFQSLWQKMSTPDATLCGSKSSRHTNSLGLSCHLNWFDSIGLVPLFC